MTNWVWNNWYCLFNKTIQTNNQLVYEEYNEKFK